MLVRSVALLCLAALAAIVCPTTAAAEADGVVARWDFASVAEGTATETVGGTRDAVSGAVAAEAGPVGPAARFDGESTAIRRAPLARLDPNRNAAVVCWLRLDAYPWNDLPILDQEDTRGSVFFGVDARGRLVARVRGAASVVRAVSATSVPLRRWTLVTIAVDDGRAGFFLDDRRTETVDDATPAPSAATTPAAGDLVVGHVRRALLPEPAGMIHPYLPIEYALEGAIGALTVYDRAISQRDVSALFARADRRLLAPAPAPHFPRSGGAGPFGAFYTTLAYDPAWDASRRVAPDSDVVVRFPGAPIRLVFWQGTSYVPAWVTENGRWYTDQFVEVYGRPRCPDGEDCEPMSDKQVRYSRVRILESTPARAVIHWRYALSEVEKYGIADAPAPLAWGDWADEYWTVYPDGVAVRRQVLWSTAPERAATEFQESIVLVPPGETPEDNIEFDALTFANLDGATHTYGWRPKTEPGFALPRGPEAFSEPAGAVIQRVNLKSEWKPFLVAWGDGVRFTAYNGEKSISSFEWWNHWPVAQIASSGRPALAADRAGHTSLSHVVWPAYAEDARRVERVLLTGLTDAPAEALADVARSWREPAPVACEGAAEAHYDAAQRAYVVTGAREETIRLTLHATARRPVVNLAIVVEDWPGGPATMMVAGSMGSTRRVKIGFVDGLDRTRLVAYAPLRADHDVVVEVRRE